MFPKAAFAALVIGALSVNAFAVPVARSPTPVPECKFLRPPSAISYHDLTSSPSIAQELEARISSPIGFTGLEARGAPPPKGVVETDGRGGADGRGPRPKPRPKPQPPPKPDSR